MENNTQNSDGNKLWIMNRIWNSANRLQSTLIYFAANFSVFAISGQKWTQVVPGKQG